MKNKEKTKMNNVIIRNYPAKFCHEQSNKEDGIKFHFISFMFHGNWASFPVSEDEIIQSTDRKGNPLRERFNLNLGEPDDVRSVSVSDGKTFRFQPMFNSTIQSAIRSNRQEYLRSIAI